ncbi:hypothetical protein INS49_009457 [Diaporthe citri]|uniref:uncharacterized protein n=1 Tax=Diaporthe citri TaxID=83186 RepID=UPI001C826AA6|nr:uncharacterized protein INS49_009457 [Diaporthe citri]KAG6361233.1 hypothetical protein INS49_009457 [Diaporthe citri]
MERSPAVAELHAPGVSGAQPDKKQRTAKSDTPTSPTAIPPQPINQDSAEPESADPDSSDLEATISVTEEDSAASESEYSSTDEEENESDQKDLSTRTVVPVPEGDVSYAALSYVWGTSGYLENGYDKLPESLPNTISDAILVTQKLKLRYLWIDRYCIRQEPQTKKEEDEKHGQIARMNHIYAGSSMTIIAAAGHGPDHGLPGVSTSRRSPPIVRLPHRTLFATLPDPKLLVDTSAWSTRIWTFQEGLLARRRLVFTDQQVYFECGETGDAEAWEECHEEDMFRYFNPNQNTPLYPYFSLGNGGHASIWPRIDDYTKLTLGDPQKDILNGILGVLTHYEGLSSMRHIAGLPLLPWTSSDISWAEAFANALSWECDDPGERRAQLVMDRMDLQGIRTKWDAQPQTPRQVQNVEHLDRKACGRIN